MNAGITAFLGLNIEYNMTSGYPITNVAGDLDTRRSRTGKLVLCAGEGPIRT